MATHKSIEIPLQKRVLVIGHWWVIWTTITAYLHTSWINVTGVWRSKLKELWDRVTINWQELSLPEPLFILPENKFYDYIFIATKLGDTLNTLAQLRKNNITTRDVIIIQNWLVPDKYYQEYELWWLNITTLAIFEALQFSYNNWISRLVSKEWWKIKLSETWKDIALLLSNAWIQCNPDQNIETQRARKLIVNCLVSWLSIVYNQPIGKLFENPDSYKQMELIFEECFRVFKRKESTQLWDKLDEKESIFRSIKQNYSPHYPSAHQDFVQKKASEIDFINGYIIQLGKKHWIPTPVNQRVYDEVKKIESTYL